MWMWYDGGSMCGEGGDVMGRCIAVAVSVCGRITRIHGAVA